jgi:hypothetical protein
MDISGYRSSNPLEANIAIQFIKRHEKKLAVIISTLFMLFAQMHINAKHFVGDAGYYWDLSSFIWDLSLPQSYRGYFYPLLLSPAKFIFDTFPGAGYLAFYASQALVFSFTLTIFLPYVFTGLIGGQVSFSRRLVAPACVAFFFPGLVAYPLSDLPALCLIIVSFTLILSASKQSKITNALILTLLAGIAAYGAYNTRTIYLFTTALLVMLTPILALKSKPIVARTILTAAFILGAAIAATPQALINLKHLGSPTPLVISNFNNTSLFANQLKWGITVQRYETGYNAESGAIFPIYYVDPTGERVFKDHDIGEAYATIPWYFSILLSEPVSFLKIYTKHLINGLDVRDGDPYTRIRSKENNFLSIASISIAMLGLFCLASLILRSSRPSNQIPPGAIWTFTILLPVLAILPGAIETRFFLPLHLIAYCSIAFGLSIQYIKSMSIKKILLLCAVYFAIVVLSYVSARESISNPVYEVPKEYIK